MDDTISRTAAIDALNEYFSRIGKLKRRGLSNAEKAISLDTVGAIKSLPSAQQWIPCSERLPEVGRSVLLSVGSMYTAEGCLRDDGDWAQFRWTATLRKDRVDAWCPLPEPWKGERDG